MSDQHLPPHDHRRRREAVRRSLAGLVSAADRGGANHGEAATDRDLPADPAPRLDVWLLVTDPRNVRYLSGFTGSSAQVLLGPDADADRLITDHRYTGRAVEEAPDLGLVLDRDPVGVALRAAGAAILAVEAAHLTWAEANELRHRAGGGEGRPTTPIRATTGLVERHRAVKDDAEVARLTRACAITQQALQAAVDELLVVGVSERQLAIGLERRFVDLGADGVAFPSIVASGPNGAVPHHEPTDRQLQPGELVTIDCGALIDGYHADHTRTLLVPGAAPEPQLAEVHGIVEAAQRAGRAAARAGASGHDIDTAARELVADAGYAEAFVHGTGHGVGLAIHEAPTVAQGATGSLPAGSALTVEPGIYLDGIGGVRIEDIVVLHDGEAATALTDTPRTLR